MTGRDRALLRHFLAALAYRTQKALRGAPAGFGDFDAGGGTRTPRALLHHMSDVLDHARARFGGEEGGVEPLPSLADETVRFHRVLEELGRHLDAGHEPDGATPQTLLQGPLADAMTHAGQLAMLRRLHGSPVPPESFIDADVDARRLGPDQPEPRRPHRDWSDGPT